MKLVFSRPLYSQRIALRPLIDPLELTGPPPPKGIKLALTNPVWTLQRCKLLIFVDIDSKRFQYLANSDRKSAKGIRELGEFTPFIPSPWLRHCPRECADLHCVFARLLISVNSSHYFVRRMSINVLHRLHEFKNN